MLMHCTKDFPSYIQSNYPAKDYVKTFSKLSEDDNHPPKALVKSTQPAYSFDKIVSDFFQSADVQWRSADAFRVDDESLLFVEFKSGFLTRLTRDIIKTGHTYCCPNNTSIINCAEVERVKDDYCNIFELYREAQIEQLIVEIQLKMLETLKFLECNLSPLSVDCCKRLSLKFILVTDCKYISGDPSNAYLVMQKMCAKQPSAQGSGLIVNRLKKFLNKNLHSDIGFYFDEVEVLEASEFDKRYA